MKKLAVLLMLAVLAVSCTDKGAAPISDKSDADKINVAKVNGVPISNDDIKDEFNMLPRQVQQMFAGEEGLQSLLDDLIKKELLYQEAKKRGIPSSEEYRKKKEDIRKQIAEELKKQEEYLTKRLVIELLLEKEVDKKSAVDDREVREFYDKNKQNFVMEIPDKKEPLTLEFDAVKDRIKQHLTAKKQEEIFDSYIEKLRGTSKVEIDKDALGKAFGNITGPTEERGK